MKKLVVHQILRSTVDLNGVAIDQVSSLLTNTEGYHNIRFQENESFDYAYDIVGSRFETDAEARKRIDDAKNVRQKKQEDKQKEIKYLEQRIAKLKAAK